MGDNLTCPNCSVACRQLIACDMAKKLVCPSCHPDHSRRSAFNWSLHDLVVNDGKTKVTRGKAWEIDNRTVSKDDGRTVVNKVTGKPAQY